MDGKWPRGSEPEPHLCTETDPQARVQAHTEMQAQSHADIEAQADTDAADAGDAYWHEDAGLFYTPENCPGLGCDMVLFHAQLAGCSCSADGCCDTSSCSCAGGGGPERQCNSACTCGRLCRRRVVQRGPRRHLTVFSAGRRGLGLRTETDIPIGQFVCCYAGEVLGGAEAGRRLSATAAGGHNYILAVREHCAGRVTTTYIDATRVCNIGHYINHSCWPSLALRPVRLDSPVPHAALFALRAIAAGEELTFSYGSGTAAGAVAGARRCLCGEEVCCGWMPSENVLGENDEGEE